MSTARRRDLRHPVRARGSRAAGGGIGRVDRLSLRPASRATPAGENVFKGRALAGALRGHAVTMRAVQSGSNRCTGTAADLGSIPINRATCSGASGGCNA
jgi:hypothetical protein